MKLSQLTTAVLAATLGLSSISIANADTVLFVGKMRQESFWNTMEAGATKAAQDLGVDLVIKGDPAGSESVENQIKYIEEGIQSGVQAIAVAALDDSATDAVLQEAMSAGIKVIGFDSDPGLESRDYFVNQADPELLADALVNDMNQAMLRS